MKAFSKIAFAAWFSYRWYCEHFHNLTATFTDESGAYQRCLDCGRRISRTEPFSGHRGANTEFYFGTPQRLTVGGQE